MKRELTEFGIKRPWVVIILSLVITAFFGWQFPSVTIDTDPENMLEADEPARLFHDATKDEFALHDFIAVGVVAKPTAFTSDLLNRIYRISEEIADLDGVIADDIMAPSMVDDISQGTGGELVIKSLMSEEIDSDDEALHIFERIMDNPLLRGKLASADGQTLALFIPIESKDQSARIGKQIREITGRLGGDYSFYIAGLPLAEDSFGTEMFVQMAYSAPVAMLIIFLLMLLFFRKAKMVAAPLVIAMMSVIWAMGLLILTGNTVHIMSSMIPIFLIPIAVLDAVHIISEFHDSYKRGGDKTATLRKTISDLFVPMAFTTVTTIAGFVSLALTPIPPVRVFGIFVAFGILVAWILSMTLLPAFITLISEKTLSGFGATDDSGSLLLRAMRFLRGFSSRRSRSILATAALVMVVAGYGLSLIVVNDNPVKWFKKSHPIRVADRVMNDHLAGTYMNYLVFSADSADAMKNPAVVRYMESIQSELESNRIVGATTGMTDIIKKVRYELFGADSSKLSLPDTREEIAQMLFMFEISGGDPDDLFKLVTPDYSSSNLWIQMTEGDNLAVSSVIDQADRFMDAHPLPEGIRANWAGLPYINIKWQEQMVSGMGKSLFSSFIVVFIMMILLFRSFRWGLVSMLPLSLTIMVIYAFIGYIGKPYDMPMAVLSSLTLGLSIDFAIHYIQRLRSIHKETGDYVKSLSEIFESTGRAISRNVLVIAIGFIPMFFSTLMPYKTVGAFFFAIMVVSGLATLVLLPAISHVFHRSLLPVRNSSDSEERITV